MIWEILHIGHAVKSIVEWATHDEFREAMKQVLRELNAQLIEWDDNIFACTVPYADTEYTLTASPDLLRVVSNVRWTAPMPKVVRDGLPYVERQTSFQVCPSRDNDKINILSWGDYRKLPASQITARIKDMLHCILETERRLRESGLA